MERCSRAAAWPTATTKQRSKSSSRGVEARCSSPGSRGGRAHRSRAPRRSGAVTPAMPHTLTRVTGREVRLLPGPPGERALELMPTLAAALDGRGPVWRPVAAEPGAGVAAGVEVVAHLATGEDD